MQNQVDAYPELRKPLGDIPGNFSIPDSVDREEIGVGVSLSHDDQVFFCVAGKGMQGCDIAPMGKRTKQEWMGLLPSSQHRLMMELAEDGDPTDLAGMRIWSAIEALRKATNGVDIRLEVHKRYGDSVCFRSNLPDARIGVLTFPVALTRGPEKVVSVVVQLEDSVLDSSNGSSEADGLIDNKVYIYRFPPAFKSYGNLSRTLYFSNYFTMMAKLRGIGLGDAVYEQTAKQLATGKWGMVTNHSETRILDYPQGTDAIESHLWLGNVSGAANSTIDFNFDWYRVLPDEQRERIAFSKQRATWVKIIDHAVAKPHAFPDYLMEAMEKLLVSGTPPLPSPLPDKLPEIDFGAEICCAPPGPSAGPILHEGSFQTALEDSDLVGNINFANYFVWQGRVRDAYFHELAPAYYQRNAYEGELLCCRSRVQHLREAMPFDRIQVAMSLRAVYGNGVSLSFEYFRQDPDGKKQKLAFGEHDAVWRKPGDGGNLVPAPLPEKIREALLAVLEDNR
ncbi:acyl-CoA thioesterase [Verrucomicrobiota bacterium]